MLTPFASDHFGPMVLVEVGNRTFRTSAQPREFNPVWEFPFIVLYRDAGERQGIEPGTVARFHVVDFDGAKTLKAWRWWSPSTPEKEVEFVSKNCPLVVDGVGYTARFLEQIREGKRPVHL